MRCVVCWSASRSLTTASAEQHQDELDGLPIGRLGGRSRREQGAQEDDGFGASSR